MLLEHWWQGGWLEKDILELQQQFNNLCAISGLEEA